MLLCLKCQLIVYCQIILLGQDEKLPITFTVYSLFLPKLVKDRIAIYLHVFNQFIIIVFQKYNFYRKQHLPKYSHPLADIEIKERLLSFILLGVDGIFLHGCTFTNK